MRKLILAAATIAFAAAGASQTYVRDLDAMTFSRDSAAYLEPLCGGMNAPMQQFHDIDGDGDLDLFVFDSDFYVERLFFRNIGTAASPAFAFEPEGGFTGSAFRFWFRFVDYDGDGTSELLTDDDTTGVRVWRNAGTEHDPLWAVDLSGLVDTAGEKLFAGFGSLPGFADLDGDGLADYLSSNSADGSFNYYRNLGTPGSPAWALVSNRLSGITITSDTCTKESAPAPSAARGRLPDAPAGAGDGAHHGMGAVSLSDLDLDGSVDLYYGDFFSHSLFPLPNHGSVGAPDLDCGSGLFPPDGSLQTAGFNQATFADIDADGDPDLFVAVLNSRTRNSFWQYRNDGVPGAPDFTFVTKDYLFTLDVGQNARPAYADLDGDLDPDLVIGNNEGQLWCFLNEGSILAPVYRLSDTAFAGISGNFSYAPAFADIDADGDPDLLLGRFDGRVIVFANDAGAFAPVDTLTASQYAVPAAGDVDGDGDFDLVVGKGNGSLTLFRNTGTPAAPQFVKETDAYLAADAGDNARPAFRINPSTGRADLFVAPAAGNGPDGRPRLRFYRNTGTGEPPFVLEDSAYGPPLPFEPAAVFGDPDGDGDDDLLVGTSKGGLAYYRCDAPDGVAEGEAPVPARFRLDQNFPNPFNGSTVITFDLAAAADLRAEVFDIHGRRVALLADGRRGPGPGRLEWNAGAHPSGVYYYRMSAGGRSLARTMMLIK